MAVIFMCHSRLTNNAIIRQYTLQNVYMHVVVGVAVVVVVVVTKWILKLVQSMTKRATSHLLSPTHSTAKEAYAQTTCHMFEPCHAFRMPPFPPRGFPTAADQFVPMVLFVIPVMADVIDNIHNVIHSNMITCTQYVVPPFECTFFMHPVCALDPCLLYETRWSY